MKIYNFPYFDNADGLMYLLFGLPKSESMFTTIHLAKANASEYAEVLFK